MATAADARPEAVGRLFLELSEQARTVHFFAGVRDDDGDVTRLFVIDVVRHDGTRAGATRACVAECLQAVLSCRGSSARKCRVCHRWKGAEEYSRSRTANTRDGRLPRCKVCERVRVKQYQLAKRALRSAASPHELN